MAILQKYNSFIDALASGAHNMKTAAFRCALTNAVPNAGTDTTMTYAPPAAVAGYPSGGNALVTTSATTTGGVFKLVLQDTVFTASGGSIGPFRYVVVYNATAANLLVGFYDYANSITLGDTDTFTVDFDDTNGVLTVT
jgi:hypothetical protein